MMSSPRRTRGRGGRRTIGQRLLASHAIALLIGAGGWWLAGRLRDLDGGFAGLLAPWLAVSLWFVTSHWVERSLSLPLVRLRDDVEKIGDGRLGHQKSPVPSDEIGELTMAIRSSDLRLERLLASLWQTNRDLERRVSERTLELEERNRTLESVVDTIVHDLRATAVSMQGVAGKLLERRAAAPPSEEDRALRRLLAMTEYQERLLRDLLTVVRLGSEPPKIREVDAGGLIREVIEECQAESEVLADALRLPPDFPVVSADPARLKAVFTHLIQNAIKFMGEQPPEVEISARADDGVVEFSIRDNGIGIDPAYHGKIFELFHRLGEIESDGTGVGLTIVRQIVEQGGGRVWVDSRKGEGTTVSFTVPAGRAVAAHRESEVAR